MQQNNATQKKQIRNRRETIKVEGTRRDKKGKNGLKMAKKR